MRATTLRVDAGRGAAGGALRGAAAAVTGASAAAVAKLKELLPSGQDTHSWVADSVPEAGGQITIMAGWKLASSMHCKQSALCSTYSTASVDVLQRTEAFLPKTVWLHMRFLPAMQWTGLIGGIYLLARQVPSNKETEPAQATAGEPQSLPSTEVISVISSCLAGQYPRP